MIIENMLESYDLESNGFAITQAYNLGRLKHAEEISDLPELLFKHDLIEVRND